MPHKKIPLSRAYLLVDTHFSESLGRDLNPQGKSSRRLESIRMIPGVDSLELLSYAHLKVPQEGLYRSVQQKLGHSKFSPGRVSLDGENPVFQIDGTDMFKGEKYVVVGREVDTLKYPNKTIVIAHDKEEDRLLNLMREAARMTPFKRQEIVAYVDVNDASKLGLV